jgi:ribosome-associated protein
MAKTVKQNTAKKTPVKKVAKKSAAAKKAAKTAAKKKAPVKKATAKKVAVKKTAAKKAVTIKKPAAKKAATPKKAVKSTKAKKTVEKLVQTKTMRAGEWLALNVAQGMFEKKAENIRILDLRNVPGASADFFVISHADNDKQVEAIARSLEDEVKKNTGQTPWHREGFQNLQWVLVDYIDVVAHVFLEEKRHFYNIEGLWGDAKEIPFKGK